MSNPEQKPRRGLLAYPTRNLILASFAAFAAANLIHNRFGVDPAIVPAVVFVGLLIWRYRLGFLVAAAIVIALPAFAFLKWSALTSPAETTPFLNHSALLLAGTLAIAALATALMHRRTP